MRTALNEALGPPPSPGYSPGLAQDQPILAIFIQELRDRVVANWNPSSQIPPDGHASLSYDSATNRITTSGFAYDKAGNQVRALISGGASQRFQYDAANRLVKVKADDNQTVIASYTYGDSNERLVAQEGSLRTYYACGGKAEYIESGGSTIPQWSKSYIYLGARLLSTLTPSGSGGEFVQYHHPDRLSRHCRLRKDECSHPLNSSPIGPRDQNPRRHCWRRNPCPRLRARKQRWRILGRRTRRLVWPPDTAHPLNRPDG